eukprot:Sspe_Gene.89056::Locus_60919_Transcript_1_1_Confidence_1.000_Length_425::g.89056::m.89056
MQFWITINEGEYDKINELFSEKIVVRCPGWGTGAFTGKDACAKFFQHFIMGKEVTNTDLSFFQGYHPAGEDDGSHKQIVNWVVEEGKSKSGGTYKGNYCAKFEMTDGVILSVDILMDRAFIKDIYGDV